MDIDGEWLPVPCEALPKELRRRVDHFWSNMYHKDGVRLYWPAIPTTYNDDAKKLFSNEDYFNKVNDLLASNKLVGLDRTNWQRSKFIGAESNKERMTLARPGAFALRPRLYVKRKCTPKARKIQTTRMVDRFGGDDEWIPAYQSADGTPMYPDPYNEKHQAEVYREFAFGGDPERDIFRMNELEMPENETTESGTKGDKSKGDNSSAESVSIDKL